MNKSKKTELPATLTQERIPNLREARMLACILHPWERNRYKDIPLWIALLLDK